MDSHPEGLALLAKPKPKGKGAKLSESPKQKTFTDPALSLGFPHVINLVTDPQEREPYNPVSLHAWTLAHFARLISEYQASVQREPLIPAGAPLDFVPKRAG